jgi:hypothetical protein
MQSWGDEEGRRAREASKRVARGKELQRGQRELLGRS